MILCTRSQEGEAGLAPIVSALGVNAVGYGLEWWAESLDGRDAPRIVFVQEGAGTGTIAAFNCNLTRGDVCVLAAGATLEARGISGLSISLPRETEVAHLPPFLRPDQDEIFTDQPGGCAEEERAYRRILLTWDEANGPFVLHALNCHRVRMWNSLSHYHDPIGGFDEFYLVQGVESGAEIRSGPADPITSEQAADAEGAGRLLQCFTPQVGDLIHIPRGTVHRATGGVLAQVITIPGFIPGAEIGVDHHLRRICERLGLAPGVLPFSVASSDGPVVR